jgi:hypothetical protein
MTVSPQRSKPPVARCTCALVAHRLERRLALGENRLAIRTLDGLRSCTRRNAVVLAALKWQPDLVTQAMQLCGQRTPTLPDVVFHQSQKAGLGLGIRFRHRP